MKSLLKQLHNVDDEPQGPSIESDDIEERIQCRRLRIKTRVENQQKLERGETNFDKNRRIELSKSRKQMELSRARVNKLNEDGLEFLTNVKVASDARENARCAEDDEMSRVRREKLESEAKTAQDRFEEFQRKQAVDHALEAPDVQHSVHQTSRLSKPVSGESQLDSNMLEDHKEVENALQKEIPQDLNEMLNQQTEACNVMIDDKNKMIAELQLECKAKDGNYVKELQKQAEDIDLMVQRMNEQVECMTKAYRDELNEIETAFMAQRDDLMKLQNKEWNELLEAIKNKQIDYLEARKKRADDNDTIISNMRASHTEEYNELKIKLENEVQTLEQNIQTAKATYQLNLEKLEYNFQVLKKRDEENTITKSQQKRKITKLQDTLNNLKQKYDKTDKQCKNDNENLTEDYKRRMELFRELQQKSRTLLKADAKHFREIWLMNEKELQQEARRLLDADKIICEQQLGITWQPPDTSFLYNKGPLQKIVKSPVPHHVSSESRIADDNCSVTQILRDVLRRENAHQKKHPLHSTSDQEECKVDEEITSINIYHMEPSTVKALMNLVCDEGSFLIEDKLKKLLEPLDEEEAMLMKLDAIFSALGIDSEKDINKMLPYFIVQMSEGETVPDTIEQDDLSAVTSTLMFKSDFYGSNKGTSPVIHPTQVIKALHNFIVDFYQEAAEMEKQIAVEQADDFQLDAVDTRDDSHDSEYWLHYSVNLIDKDKETVWDALTESLDKYLNVLNLRKKILTDVDAYRTQNQELRFLLQQYLTSSVNRDLQVPPSKVIEFH